MCVKLLRVREYKSIVYLLWMQLLVVYSEARFVEWAFLVPEPDSFIK